MSLYDNLKKSAKDLGSFYGEINIATRKSKILNSVYLEITPFCNFTCPFCYARKTPEQLKCNGEHVMLFDEWKEIIDQLYMINVQQIVFTGGECSLHPDFCKLYRYAYNLGFEISVMTNCSNITDEIFEMFKEMPPISISMTLYSSSPEGYEKICGNSKYYDIVINNIKKLKNQKFLLGLKQTVTNDNLEDTIKIYELSKELGIRFAHSDDLTTFDSCTSEKIEINEVDRDKKKYINEYIYRDKKKISEDEQIPPFKMIAPNKFYPFSEKGITCGSGNNIAYIDYKGEMCPCVAFDAVKFDVKKLSIKEAWNRMTEWASNVPNIKECHECPFVSKCPTCISLHYNDTHEFGVPSPRLCWKKKHPEKAEKLLKYYDEHGYIMSDMLDD